MASEVLASRNESSWGQSTGGFTGKLPYSNHLNPKSNSKKKQFQPLGGQMNGRRADDSPAVMQAVSEDTHSYSQRPMESNHDADFNHGGYVVFDLVSYTRNELVLLKRRLHSELDQIQRLKDRIESGKLEPRSNGAVGGGGVASQFPHKSKKISGKKRSIPVVSKEDPAPSYQMIDNRVAANPVDNANSMKMCRHVLTKLMKQKNSWIFNKPVDAASLGLHDYHTIIKRPMDLGTVKSNFTRNLYNSPSEFADDVRLTFNNALRYNPKGDEVHKMAEMLLDRFEELYRPIQRSQGAERPQQHHRQPQQHHRHQQPQQSVAATDELQGSSWYPTPMPEKKKKKLKPNTMQTPKKPEKRQMQSLPSASIPSPPPPSLPVMHQQQQQSHQQQQSPVRSPSPNQQQSMQSLAHSPSPNPQQSMQSLAHSPPSPKQTPGMRPSGGGVRTYQGKQPKPKAKDPNKRDMSIEEKHKLGVGLQNLPQEKMPQLVQIIRKRNSHLSQEGDEIELDIEAIDTETLWELDRFVTNWKKLASKVMRQALMVNNNSSGAPTGSGDDDNVYSMSERTDTAEKQKKGEGGEEDVDIGDEMPMSSFPTVEIQKDEGRGGGGHASSSRGSSSSSGSDSSSSSGSDSDSSSGSDSDADDAQSRGGHESKEPPKV